MGGNGSGAGKVYVTVSGLALLIRLDWPFRPSTSGADFWTLHAEISPVGKDLKALVAINLAATVRNVLPTLDPKDAEAPAINALRKEFDRFQIEFMKSAKLVPLGFSSRHYSLKRQIWTFHEASDAQIDELILRKVYWQSLVNGRQPVLVADPIDAQYLGTANERLVAGGKKLAEQGVVKLEGNFAMGSEVLMSHGAAFEDAQQHALEELEKKHAFERG